MKEVSMEQAEKEHGYRRQLFDSLPFRTVDWKESPSDVLTAIDMQLRMFGLEIVQFDTGGDDYIWKIEKRSLQEVLYKCSDRCLSLFNGDDDDDEVNYKSQNKVFLDLLGDATVKEKKVFCFLLYTPYQTEKEIVAGIDLPKKVVEECLRHLMDKSLIEAIIG